MADSLGSDTVSFKSEYVDIRELTQKITSPNHRERCSILTSSRWVVAHVCFWGTASLFCVRQAMSMALVCMFPEKGGETTGKNINSTVDTNRNTTQLDWSDEIQGLILSAHFYGYLVSPMFGGYLATKYGGKQVLVGSMCVVVIVTLLTPITALYSPVAVIFLRVVLGLSSGPVAPSMQELLNRWTPSPEKSKLLSFSYAGSNVGNVIAFAFSGFLCTLPLLGGWPLIFYVFGGSTVLWIVWVLVFVHNSPESHPRIAPWERQYVMNTTPKENKLKITRPPCRQVLTSLPLMACLVCQFVNASTQTVTGVTLPLYMRDVLDFPVAQNGIFSALPPMGRFCGMLISGYLSDYIVKRNILSMTAVRKMFLCLGYMVPALFMLVLSYLDSSRRELAVIILVCMATSSAAAMITLRVNVTEIAPRYASVLVGALMTVNGVPGIIVPLGVTLITSEGTREQWQIVFFICVALYTLASLFFVAFGSSTEQNWAKYQSLEQEEIVENEHDYRGS